VEVSREVRYAPVGHYGAIPPEVRPLGDKSRWLVEWLKSNTTRDGGILFETSKARVHDGAHMAGYYRINSDREFLGGPYPFTFKADFWDETVFGRPIASVSHDQLRRLLDLYNVGWVVVHSQAAKQYFETAPGISLAAEHEDLRIYRAERSLSYFVV